MSTDEIIKEKIIAETAKLQIHLIVIIALAGGIYGICINFIGEMVYEDIINLDAYGYEDIINLIVFGLGIFFLLFFSIAVLRNYISIRDFLIN